MSVYKLDINSVNNCCKGTSKLFITNVVYYLVVMLKNIIFDLGGVLIDIDVKRIGLAFLELGAKNLVRQNAFHRTDKVLHQFESGQIEPDEFRYQVKKMLRLEHISDDEFDRAWNTVLIAYRINVLEFLHRLREKNYRLFLYSNTNAIHHKRFHQMCAEQFDAEDVFEDAFDHIYYSYIIGQSKPGLEGFRGILQEQSLVASETLFIDDSVENIRVAKELGMQVLHFTANKILADIETFLQDA